MNRRSWLRGFGVSLCTVTGTVPVPNFTNLLASSIAGTPSPQLPQSVAGVRIIDSPLAKAATTLTSSVSPPYLFHHAMRTFLYGSLVGRALGQHYDEEAFYLACILHDLGLTEKFAGDRPFEIEGAEAARKFLAEQGYSASNTEIVWDGIAMHASAIGSFKRPEIALVGEGAGSDVLGPDFSQINKADSDAILRAFPRLQFKTAFMKTCADVVRKHPRGASRSFMRDIGERYVPNFHPQNFCDLVEQSPFEE